MERFIWSRRLRSIARTLIVVATLVHEIYHFSTGRVQAVHETEELPPAEAASPISL